MATDRRIDWQTNPEDAAMAAAFPLKRCPASGKWTALLLSTNWLGVNLHYWRGRTTPHLLNDCPACNDKTPFRWRGYLCAAHPETHTRFALEVTAPVILALQDYKAEWGTLRGGILTLIRPSGKANGRLLGQMHPSHRPPADIPAEFDLQNLLLKLWECPAQQSIAPDVNRIIGELTELNGNGHSEKKPHA